MTFATPSPAEWRTLAEKALKDRPLESLVHLDADGLALRPLYAGATGVEPVFAPRASDADGRAWDDMEVDYRAEARTAVLAAAGPDHAWLATDTGMILRWVKE